MESKGQTISTDVLIAIAIFVIVMAFFLVIGINLFPEIRNLDSEAEKLESAVSTSTETSPALIEGAKVNEEALSELLTTKYEDLKNDLGMRADFCIYFEDDKGNVVLLSNNTGNSLEVYGIGAEQTKVAGIPCRTLNSS